MLHLDVEENSLPILLFFQDKKKCHAKVLCFNYCSDRQNAAVESCPWRIKHLIKECIFSEHCTSFFAILFTLSVPGIVEQQS